MKFAHVALPNMFVVPEQSPKLKSFVMVAPPLIRQIIPIRNRFHFSPQRNLRPTSPGPARESRFSVRPPEIFLETMVPPVTTPLAAHPDPPSRVEIPPSE